jgi:hypothetical protein
VRQELLGYPEPSRNDQQGHQSYDRSDCNLPCQHTEIRYPHRRIRLPKRRHAAIDTLPSTKSIGVKGFDERWWDGFFMLMKASAELAQNKSISLPLGRATTTNKRRNVQQPGGLHGAQFCSRGTAARSDHAAIVMFCQAGCG